MSLSIHWQPIKGTKIDSTTTDVMKIKDIFGDELDEGDIDKLEGMALMCDCSPNPYEELIKAINKHGKIRVWGE